MKVCRSFQLDHLFPTILNYWLLNELRARFLNNLLQYSVPSPILNLIRISRVVTTEGVRTAAGVVWPVAISKIIVITYSMWLSNAVARGSHQTKIVDLNTPDEAENRSQDCRIYSSLQLISSLIIMLNMALANAKKDNRRTKVSKGGMKRKMTASPDYNLLHSQKEPPSWLKKSTLQNVLNLEANTGQVLDAVSVQEFWYNGEVQRHTWTMVKVTGTLRSQICADRIGVNPLQSSTPGTVWKPVPGTGDRYQVSLRRAQRDVLIWRLAIWHGGWSVR